MRARSVGLSLCLSLALGLPSPSSAEEAAPPSAPVLDPNLGTPIPEDPPAQPSASDETADGAPVPDPYALPAGEPAPEKTEEPQAETAEAPPAETPPEPVPAEDTGSSARSEARAEFDPDHPAYQRLRPNWAVQVYGAYSALGSAPLIASKPESYAPAILADFDFQPAIIQAVGVIGIGVSGGIFPASSADDALAEPWSIYQIGVHARYQARFFREQILVPFAGLNFERLSYSVKDPTTGLQLKDHVSRQYPVFGAMLLLNGLEPTQAHEAYRDWHILRSYLVGEVRPINVTSGPLALSGSSIYMGIRVEY